MLESIQGDQFYEAQVHWVKSISPWDQPGLVESHGWFPCVPGCWSSPDGKGWLAGKWGKDENRQCCPMSAPICSHKLAPQGAPWPLSRPWLGPWYQCIPALSVDTLDIKAQKSLFFANVYRALLIFTEVLKIWILKFFICFISIITHFYLHITLWWWLDIHRLSHTTICLQLSSANNKG